MGAGTCTVCGNHYDKCFTVETHEGQEHVFDSLECAVHLLAPVCQHCGCRVIGHGVEVRGVMFCCAHCAHESDVAGAEQLRDRE